VASQQEANSIYRNVFVEGSIESVQKVFWFT